MEIERINQSQDFFSLIGNKLRFNLFLLKQLPAAYFSGVRLVSVNSGACSVSVPFRWFTKNPFRSTYFACLSMAAEMSTGILAMGHLYKKKPPVSMLVTAVDSIYIKKATGITTFVCKDGHLFAEAVRMAIQNGQPQTVKAKATGYNQQQEVVAEFWVTWSFKVKTDKQKR